MFFRRLRDLREDHDLSQASIAAIFFIHRTVYYRYECGKTTIPVPLLLALADYYKTSTDYLLGRTDRPTPYPRG